MMAIGNCCLCGEVRVDGGDGARATLIDILQKATCHYQFR